MTVYGRADRRVWPPLGYEPVEVVIHHGHPGPDRMEVVAAPQDTMITLALIANRGPLITASHDVITIAGVVDYRVVRWEPVPGAFVLRKLADRRHMGSTVALSALPELDQGSQTAEHEALG